MEGRPFRSGLDRVYLVGFAAVVVLQLSAGAAQLVTGIPVPAATVVATAFVIACMLRVHGLWGTMAFLGLVIAIPFASEFLGVFTGVPYGSYAYLDVPGPYVLGLVPIFILIAWIHVGYLAIASTTAAFGRSSLWLAPIDGLVATAWDLLVDPVAVRSGFWTWLSPATLYGVPISNFLGWFLVVTALSLAARWTWARDARAPPDAPRVVLAILPGVLLASTLQFGILATAYGFIGSAVIGLGVLLTTIAFGWRRLATTPRERMSPSPWTRRRVVARSARESARDDGRA